MSKMNIVGLAAAFLLVSAQAYAAPDNPVPPDNAKKLSQIVAGIEKRDHFHYIKDIEWDNGGFYDITYYTTDKAKVEIKINAVSGQPVNPS
ncbi:MAG: PepSY domain-containing protein [Pararhizobium sp.]